MNYIYFLFCLTFSLNILSQATYNETDYANSGDIIFLTTASVSDLRLDYEATGENFNWDFSLITGVSQETLEFKASTQSGFPWLFVLFENNTNLASTNNQAITIPIGTEEYSATDNHDFYLTSNSELKQVGKAFYIFVNNIPIPITSEFTNDDTIYHFPIIFGDSNTDTSSYTFGVPNLFSQQVTQDRNTIVDGWGTLKTPYKTYTSVLRMTTILEKTQLITVGENTPQAVTITTRIFNWFDSSEKLPVLTVTQNNVLERWITTNVNYLDIENDFQTEALYTYLPVLPNVNEEVSFVNLSINATNYVWDFGDPSSGLDNTSIEGNPRHIYTSNGTYQVSLTATNNTFTDTLTLPIIVNESALKLDDFQIKKTKIYPNPFTNKINFNRAFSAGTTYSLYNMLGQKLYQGASILDEDFSHLPSGSYSLKINENKIEQNFMLIKKN